MVKDNAYIVEYQTILKAPGKKNYSKCTLKYQENLHAEIFEA